MLFGSRKSLQHLAALLAVALIEAGCAEKPAPPPPPPVVAAPPPVVAPAPVKKKIKRPPPKKQAKPIVVRTPLPQGFTIDVPSSPAASAAYAQNGKPLASEDTFTAALNTTLTASLSQVPSLAPIGSLRLIMPIRTLDDTNINTDNPNGSRQYANAMLDYQRMLDRYHDAALEHSGGFQPVTVDSDPAPISDGKSEFSLWFRNGRWHLRYHEGDVHDIADSPDLPGWVAAVRAAAEKARSEGGRVSMLYSIQTNGNGAPHFRFAGDDYASATDLAPALKAAWIGAGDQVTPLAQPIGAKLRIVVPAHPKPADISLAHADAADGPEIRQADKAFYDAVTAGEIESIRKSGLFQEVEVKTQDVTDVIVGANDATLWRAAKAPEQWSFRIAGDETTHEFAPPHGHPTMQEWLNALAQQMRAAQKQPRS
ncbi:MAG TPA: hypothetical protein VL574_02885 [Stellaceae bacterium]|nr:hypothetical protein [Stellaceae bacterium]